MVQPETQPEFDRVAEIAALMATGLVRLWARPGTAQIKGAAEQAELSASRLDTADHAASESSARVVSSTRPIGGVA